MKKIMAKIVSKGQTS